MILSNQSYRYITLVVIITLVTNLYDRSYTGCLAWIITSMSIRNDQGVSDILSSNSLMYSHGTWQTLTNHHCLLRRIQPYVRQLSIKPLLSLSSDECVDLNDQQQEVLLQQLQEPFDRWRYLQKLLDDDDINNAIEIVFVLKTLLRRQLKLKYHQATYPLNHLKASTNEEIAQRDNPATNVSTETLPTISKLDDTDENESRRQTMDYIVHNVSHSTIQNLLDNNNNIFESSSNELYVLRQLEQLLPNPETDEDASQGLWDTVIELHGREAVKINQQKEEQNNIPWKTRCIITRLFIYYDFLSDGLQ